MPPSVAVKRCFVTTVFPDKAAHLLAADKVRQHHVRGTVFVELCGMVVTIGVTDEYPLRVPLVHMAHKQQVGVEIGDGAYH